jgi:hypothetical protein
MATTIPTAESRTVQAADTGQRRAIHGLLWREWLDHGPMVLNFLAAWLVGGWVLQVFFHPGWILGFGVLYAFAAGAMFGGGDAFEGSEEFSFSLPPTRGKRYLVRLAAGGVPLLLFTVLGLLAIGLDLPQILWGIFVSSGYTEPFKPAEPAFLHYGLAFAVPAAAYAFTYVFAALAGSRGSVMVSWFTGGLIAGGVVLGGILLENGLWEEANGFVTCPALLALAPLALLAGYVRYLRKEGVSRPSPIGGWGVGWVWWIVIAIATLMFLSLISFGRSVPSSAPVRVEHSVPPPMPSGDSTH